MSKELLNDPEVSGEGEEAEIKVGGNNWFRKRFGVPAAGGGDGWKFWNWRFSGPAPPIPAAGGYDSVSVTVGDVPHSNPIPPRGWKQILKRLLLQILKCLGLLFLGPIPAAGGDDLGLVRPLLSAETATAEPRIYVPFKKLEEAIEKLKREQLSRNPAEDPITQEVIGEIYGETSQMSIGFSQLEEAIQKLKQECAGETGGRTVVIKLVADNARFSVSGFLYGLHDHYIAPSFTTVVAGLLLTKIVKDHFDAF